MSSRRNQLGQAWACRQGNPVLQVSQSEPFRKVDPCFHGDRSECPNTVALVFFTLPSILDFWLPWREPWGVAGLKAGHTF